MSNLDDLLERLREKSEQARNAIDSLPPDVRAGVDQHVCDDEDAIRAIERLRAALEEITASLELNITNFNDELTSIEQQMLDRARKALRGAV